MTETRHVLHRPQPRVDLLRAPLLGRFLRWRWGRLVLQLLLLAIAALALYDGFSGPPTAPTNIAGVVWVHYRGFVVFSLLLAGNLFCMSCPFTISRVDHLATANHGARRPRLPLRQCGPCRPLAPARGFRSPLRLCAGSGGAKASRAG